MGDEEVPESMKASMDALADHLAAGGTRAEFWEAWRLGFARGCREAMNEGARSLLAQMRAEGRIR